jgi:GDP/UDP-N,N'-diacetylbacillosamine 2-epimerase (hydrolysing)
MTKRKICVVTGTRAEYGLLLWLMKAIEKEPTLELQIIVTGMHLSHEFGLTYKGIEEDGFKISKKIEMLVSGDTASAISKSTAIGLIGFADAFNELSPHIIVLLGDRFELLSAAIAATFARIPIAHLHGGETTEGAFDEAIRHAITKMAWWHFVANDEYKRRVIQLGEHPKRVFNVGGLGVDSIKKTKLLSREELTTSTGIRFQKKNLLVTYHPVTLEDRTSHQHFQVLTDALHDLNDLYLIFTMPNADSDGRIIKKMVDQFVTNHKKRSIAFVSMGHLNYLSTMQFVDGVVGNSSSGLAEAPSFNIGTINIGDRQKGRLKAESVIDCQPTIESIKNAIGMLYSNSFQKRLTSVTSPYDGDNATEKILQCVKYEVIPKELKKEFFDL